MCNVVRQNMFLSELLKKLDNDGASKVRKGLLKKAPCMYAIYFCDDPNRKPNVDQSYFRGTFAYIYVI